MRMDKTSRNDALPATFCWTRIGSEAGQSLEDILRRKELERRASGGRFLWGIGSAVTAAVRRLADAEEAPEVLFSPMRSAPAAIDVAPTSLVAWTAFLDENGTARPLPSGSIVTSRGESVTGAQKRQHYALFCESRTPLTNRHDLVVAFERLRNAASLRAVGASQVTAVVSLSEPSARATRPYRVALRARLFAPYCARLVNPVPFGDDDLSQMLYAVSRSDPHGLAMLAAALRRRDATRVA